MKTFTKIAFSESDKGRGIQVGQTESPGTLVHTGSSDLNVMDNVWIYAANNSEQSIPVTIQYGGSDAQDRITGDIEPQAGLVLMAPGLVLQGDETPKEIRVFADEENDITIHGYVDRIEEAS